MQIPTPSEGTDAYSRRIRTRDRDGRSPDSQIQPERRDQIPNGDEKKGRNTKIQTHEFGSFSFLQRVREAGIENRQG